MCIHRSSFHLLANRVVLSIICWDKLPQKMVLLVNYYSFTNLRGQRDGFHQAPPMMMMFDFDRQVAA